MELKAPNTGTVFKTRIQIQIFIEQKNYQKPSTAYKI